MMVLEMKFGHSKNRRPIQIQHSVHDCWWLKDLLKAKIYLYCRTIVHQCYGRKEVDGLILKDTFACAL